MEIRKARRGDEPSMLGLIQELADYEKAPGEVINTVENLTRDLFDDGICEAFVVEHANQIVGFALYYTSYSTWKGRCLYLEDFYIQPAHRRNGIGGKLFNEVVQVARQRGVKRMDWQVLEWNEPALNFYRRENAILDSEWINGRLYF